MGKKTQKTETNADHRQKPGAGGCTSSHLPAMGLNDKLDFMGRQLHIQTENTGSNAACIVTQVFCNGRVFFTAKSEYPAELGKAQDIKLIQDLMRAQHFTVIEKIRSKKAKIPARDPL